MNKINCFSVTCRHCNKGVLVKTNILGDKLYICNPYPKKHKAIRGRDCGEFSCNDIHNSLVCDDCIQKIKRLER